MCISINHNDKFEQIYCYLLPATNAKYFKYEETNLIYTQNGNKQMHDFMDKINMSMETYVGFTSFLYRQTIVSIVSIDDFID